MNKGMHSQFSTPGEYAQYRIEENKMKTLTPGLPPLTILLAVLWQFLPDAITNRWPLALPVREKSAADRGWFAVVAKEVEAEQNNPFYTEPGG
jgi:hypothetical protein